MITRLLLTSLAVAAFLVTGGVSSAATDADWTGHWSFVDYCVSGPAGCPGVYTYEIDFVQTGGSVTGTGSSYTISDGRASGSTLTFTAVGSGAYRAPFHMTMSADGKSATGTATDSDGRTFTVTATGNGKPADGTHIKGRVTDSFKEGVDNVRVVANGKGGRKQSITSDGGYYDIKLSDIKKAATYNVSASNKLYRFIDPRVRKVTVKPNGTGYAAFTVATGKLRGTVRELDCRPNGQQAPTAASCRGRKVPSSAIVELRGDQVGRKYAQVEPDGSYEFKVPVGKYDLRVNRLDTSAAKGADVCKENPRIPAMRDDEVGCDKVVDVEAKKGAVKTTAFVGVPRIIAPKLRLLTFNRINKPYETASIQAGLNDPEDPELFGSYGSGSGKSDYPVVRCKSGCATIEATARNLFGKPIKGARFKGIVADPITPALGVTPGNEQGVACFAERNLPDRKHRVCRLNGSTDANGRALGIYAAPGIVPGSITQQRDGQVYTTIRTTATAPGYTDAPVSAGPLVITQNERVGTRRTSRLVLTQADADVLNIITDPNTVKQGFVHLVRTIPEACEKMARYLLPVPKKGKSGLLRTGIDKICGVLETPATLSRPLLEKYVDLLGATFVTSRLGIRADGLLAAFKWNADSIPTSSNELLNLIIPNTVTPATRSISDYLKAWRKLHGGDHFDANGKLVREPIKAGERVILRLFEVSHYSIESGILKRTPSIMLSLQADFLPAPQTLIVTGDQGYEPLRWLT